MFQRESHRLLREKWKNPQQLAEEIYAILQKRFLTDDGGTDHTVPDDRPADRYTTYNPSDVPVVSIISRDPETGQVIDQLDLFPDRIEQTHYDNGVPETVVVGEGGGGGGFPGEILSGSGDTYTVRITTGPGTTEDVQVEQIQIDPTATIPAGSGVIVAKVGDLYFMQAPVWL